MDGQGHYIARVPQGSAKVGQLASQGWRAIKDQTGLFELSSLEGDLLIGANVHPSISNWRVGLAVKKAELHEAAWVTVRWAVMLGAGLSAASLLLAWCLARQITHPINELRLAFADVSAEPGKPLVVGPPEILDLQATLHRATVERINSNQALMSALSNLEREMALREEAQAALAQSQRMEAIGQLAGGIAHDFHNVLAAISSNVDMVTLRSADENIRELVQNAMDAIQMGANLTRRLLLLSSQHEVGLERLDLNDRVTGTIELLRRSLGEQVTARASRRADGTYSSLEIPFDTRVGEGQKQTGLIFTIESTANKLFGDVYCTEPWRAGFLQCKVFGLGDAAPDEYTHRVSVPAGWPSPLGHGSNAERLILVQAHRPRIAYMYTQWKRRWQPNATQMWSLAAYEWSRFPGLRVSLRADGIDPVQLDPLVETLDAQAAAYVRGPLKELPLSGQLWHSSSATRRHCMIAAAA
jgi:signal transduction histidine kinase